MLQGFSTINENEGGSVEETDGIDFIDMEAGGFDNGQGDRNVSNPDSMVRFIYQQRFLTLSRA